MKDNIVNLNPQVAVNRHPKRKKKKKKKKKKKEVVIKKSGTKEKNPDMSKMLSEIQDEMNESENPVRIKIEKGAFINNQ